MSGQFPMTDGERAAASWAENFSGDEVAMISAIKALRREEDEKTIFLRDLSAQTRAARESLEMVSAKIEALKHRLEREL